MLLSLPTLKDIQANDPYTYEALVKIRAAVNSLLAQIAPLSATAGALGGVSQPPLKPTPQAVLPAIENPGGAWSNAGFCLFGNPNIGRSHSNLTDANPSLTVSGFASFATFRTALVLNAVSSVARNDGADLVTVEYSTDGGVTWNKVSSFFPTANTFAQRLDAIPLPSTQDVTKIQVRLRMLTNSAPHTVTLFAPRMIETVLM